MQEIKKVQIHIKICYFLNVTKNILDVYKLLMYNKNQ